MTTTQDFKVLHPSEIAAHLSYEFRSSVLMWGCSALAAGLALGSFAIDEWQTPDRSAHWQRTGLIGGGFAAALLAYAARENAIQRRLISLDAADISAASRQQRYYETMKPTAESAVITVERGAFNPELFDLSRLIHEPRRFPHLLFLGITGSGKTTLAEALQALMPGKNVALHPHWQQADEGEAADFAHCDQVIGGGRDFAAIAEFIEGLHDEMDNRAKLTKGQLRAKPFINVVVDELPAIAKNCGEATIERLISLLFEARKFGIRLMVMAQADSVKVLKLEGQGAVRENLCYVRLGGIAIDHAKWLVSKKLADERLIQWLEAQAYPCMIEDYPAIIPAISRGQFIGGIPTPPGTPPDGGKELFTLPTGVKDEVNSEGKLPEHSGGKVLSFPSAPRATGVNSVQNPALDAILSAAAEGKLSSGFITNELACQGKYYAGAKRIIDMITGQSVDSDVLES